MREGLGMYGQPELPAGGLTKHDLGELIRRAGVAAGFIVQPEYRALHRWIDWVWLSPDQPDHIVMAFEIEGRDIGTGQRSSIENDIARFETHELLAEQCYVLLHQVRYRTVLPPRTQQSAADPEGWINHLGGGAFHLQVKLDTQLMAPGGIEELMASAHALEAP